MEAIDLEIKIEKTSHSRLTEVDFENLVFGKTYADHMFVVDYKDGQWKDSRVVPFAPLLLSPANSSLHYGQSIFEGLKAFRGQSADEILVFRPEENARRLQKSAVRMCMPQLPEEIFMQGLRELLKLDRDWVPAKAGCSLYLRPFLFATDEYLGLRPSDNYKFMIITSPVGAYYSEPVKVKVERHYSRSVEGGTGFAKCAGNYAASMYPARQAQQMGYHQLLWTDAKEHKYIEESGSMNVMFLINNTLITAPTTDTILPGITRKSVLQLAHEWGIAVEERPLSVTELVEAHKDGSLQEAFGVGTAATISHIALINVDGTDYRLPAIETREVSNKIMQELIAVQRGQKADERGWIFTV